MTGNSERDMKVGFWKTDVINSVVEYIERYII